MEWIQVGRRIIIINLLIKWIKRPLVSIIFFIMQCDCVDISTCSEAPPSAPIDVEKLIVDMDDLAMLRSDVIVLMSRLAYM